MLKRFLYVLDGFYKSLKSCQCHSNREMHLFSIRGQGNLRYSLKRDLPVPILFAQAQNSKAHGDSKKPFSCNPSHLFHFVDTRTSLLASKTS